MQKKICIIGAGIFGLAIYLTLKRKGYNCYLIEKKRDILLGASTNNLNRIHFGYHYPRDHQTAKQSLLGYKSFNKEFGKSIIKNFDNYYAIAENSYVNFKQYLNFCKKLNLKYEKINPKNFFYENKNINTIIKVKEPIYDWRLLKKDISKKINKIKNNKIFLNVKSFNLKKIKNHYKFESSQINEKFDIIIDTAYEGSNHIQNKVFKLLEKYKYQKTCVYQFTFSDKRKFGFCLMDGKFFSFLPNGKKNSLLYYDVEHSILKQEKADIYNKKWYNQNLKKKVNLNLKKIKIKFKKYFPKTKINFFKKVYISPRVLLLNVEKTDKRVSIIKRPKKNYFKIFSAKVDHCVDIATKIEKLLNK